MSAASLPPGDRDELAALRRRAYGPDADIHTDPAALARLAQLEDAARTAVPPSPAPPVPAPPLPVPPVPAPPGPVPTVRVATTVTPVDARAAASPAPSVDESDAFGALGLGAAPPPGADAAAAPVRPRIPRAAVVLAAATVLVVVLAASVVWVATTLSGGGADRTLARVAEEADGDRLAAADFLDAVGADVDSVESYEPFETFEVWSVDSASQGRCLVITGEYLAPYGMTCAPGGLAPIVDLWLAAYEGAPALEGYPAGTVVRFELHGDQVRVRIAQGSAPPAA